MPTFSTIDSFKATRLAPSPTGALHLGHARTFLITWWLARRAREGGGGGARIFMRMEDLDTGRAKSESVQQAYDDLAWLGIDWNPFPLANTSPCATLPAAIRPGDTANGIIVQSHRVDVYQKILETLWQRRAIYPCTCTRADVAAGVLSAGSAPHDSDPGANIRYPGTCSAQNTDLQSLTVSAATHTLRDRTAKNVCWRLRVPPGPITFHDLVAGPQSFDVAAQVGDFPVTRFAGEAAEAALPAAYQLACVIDDHAMAIDCIIRGADLLASTPRQMLIYGALDWTVPHFAHLPLVIGADGKRLAKRHGESRIAQFRQQGITANRIIGWAAWRADQISQPRELSSAEALALFDPKKIPPHPLILSAADLHWLRN